MTPIPYLTFPAGTCAEAMAAYARIFGAPPPDLMPLSQAPGAADWPAEKQGLVMHATLRLGQGYLQGSDDIAGEGAAMAGSSVLVSLPDAASARAAFDALAEGGTVEMPFAATFWTAGFGTLTDRWGVRWMISTDSDAMTREPA